MTEEQSSSPAKGQEAIASITSPLAGVNPRSLDALMAEDVELLSDRDVDQIVAELQRQRAGWAASEALNQAKPRRGSAKASSGPKVAVSLEELGLVGKADE